MAERRDEMPEMRPLRARIDAFDRRIVVPLSDRAELARENELSRSQVVQRAVKARLLKTIVTAALAAQSSAETL